MSNISRRQFLKGAGVATLAVAAAGVLAGCSNVPDKPTPGVPDKTVHIYYMIGVQPVNGEPVEISVNGLATYVTYETIKQTFLPMQLLTTIAQRRTTILKRMAQLLSSCRKRHLQSLRRLLRSDITRVQIRSAARNSSTLWMLMRRQRWSI